MTTLRLKQFQDLDGNIDFMNNAGKMLTNGTTEIFTGEGVYLGVLIYEPINGGTFHFTNTAGDPIDGLPSVTLKGPTTRAGTWSGKNVPIDAGLKIVVANAVGTIMAVAAATTT